MIKKNNQTPRSRTKSKRKTKKKIVTDISFCFEVYGFLTIHVITLLK